MKLQALSNTWVIVKTADRQPFKRTDRVGDLIRQIISQAMLEKSHHLGLENITITGANVSPDLRNARVFYRVLQGANLLEARRALGRAASTLRKAVAKEMQTRNSPALMFVYDESVDSGGHMEVLLNKIKSTAPILHDEE